MCISMSAASENTRNASACSGSSSAVASGQEAHCKRALPHGSEPIPHAVAGHDAVADGNIQKPRGAAKMSGEGSAFSTSSPVKIGVSGGKFQPPVPSRSNKTAGISVRPVSTGGMWRSQVSCCRIVPWTRPWLPGCAERLRNKPGMAIMLFANNSISLIGHLKERPYLLHFQADPH